MIPNASRDPPELLREAETAMHLAKQAGDSRVRFFAHALQEAASARLGLRNDLRRALQTPRDAAQQQLLLHYQRRWMRGASSWAWKHWCAGSTRRAA
jgi:predicted signal transduction protein with EAL and GGDEF domain